MICVSVQEKDFTKCKETLSHIPMAELRGDLCGFDERQTGELVQMHPNLLYTHRFAGSSATKAYNCIIEAIKKGAKYVDVEIEAPIDYLEQIKSYARVNGCTLIISYHNYEGTQSLEELQTIYNICRRKGADIVKIVTTAHNISDASRVMQLYKYSKADSELVANNYMERGEESGSLSNSFGEEQAKLVAFCMGEAGRFTRHLCLALGAPYTYAYFDKNSATAPGQFTNTEMEELISPDNYRFATLKLEETIFNKAMSEVEIPCSKSIAQRAILAAALAKGTTTLSNFEQCNDINAALEVIKVLGAEVSVNDSLLTIKSNGADSIKGISSLFAGESGLLARIMLPLAAYLSGKGMKIEISGRGSLLERDIEESAKAIVASGAVCTTNGGMLPFKISGGIDRDYIEFSGEKSSQIVSGFLMMLPLLNHNTTLKVNNPASVPYIDLTLKVLQKFGVEIAQKRNLPSDITFTIAGGQHYKATDMYLDSDWSSATNFAVAGTLTSGITLKNMTVESAQADEQILSLLQELGCRVEKACHGEMCDITIHPYSGENRKREFTLQDSPDLFPIVAVLAALCNGETVIDGVNRLTNKESNRAESILCELSRLGFDVCIEGNKMYICGSGNISCASSKPVMCSSHNDHRIAMALYVAALAGNMDIRINNIECIDKSFPSFLERLKK